MIKSTACSSQGTRFKSQHLQGGSQRLQAPDARDTAPSSGLHEHCMNIRVHAGEAPLIPIENNVLKVLSLLKQANA